MIDFLYQIGINFFGWAVKAAAPFNEKIRLGVTGRKSVLGDMEKWFEADRKDRPVAWFHAASLGEFEQGRPVIEAYKAHFPAHIVLLTFFSPSGYEIRKNCNGADYICYLPIDTQANAQRFLAIARPSITFFIKYEFWFNYLHELKKQGSIVISFSAIFRPEYAVFKSYGAFARKMLHLFDHIFVQNEESRQLLAGIGVTQTSIAGDTRFDRVKTIAAQSRELLWIDQFKGECICLIAGSVWDTDMQVMIPALNQLKGRLKVIIAPHEISAAQISEWTGKLTLTSIRHSELNEEAFSVNYDCLVIDNIGMLSSLYRYGDLAYIGGSFGAGLHNILEAATFGLPVLFGDKSYHRFQEAVELVGLGGAQAVSDTDQLLHVLQEFVSNQEEMVRRGEISRRYVLDNTGATETILHFVKNQLNAQRT